jgi:hypothetical protein
MRPLGIKLCSQSLGSIWLSTCYNLGCQQLGLKAALMQTILKRSRPNGVVPLAVPDWNSWPRSTSSTVQV